MATLTDEQIDYVLADLHSHGIRIEGLRDNLLDHICILVEERLETGGPFEAVYAEVIPTFYREDLYELEEEALFLVSLRGPHVVLSRAWFFVLAFAIVLSPYLAYIALVDDHFDAIAGGAVLDVYPFLTLMVLFLTPNRFDPVIPWGSKILLGFRPLIRVLPGEVTAQ